LKEILTKLHAEPNFRFTDLTLLFDADWQSHYLWERPNANQEDRTINGLREKWVKVTLTPTQWVQT
jgi:hypothetical protein